MVKVSPSLSCPIEVHSPFSAVAVMVPVVEVIVSEPLVTALALPASMETVPL